ncbi:MAG TPA: hypothetical protein DCZ97_15905 [Syntrophus sp. (in: bacteria)]|nr:hypothetical protein [Syntrophus sp. (in: bacteria)]
MRLLFASLPTYQMRLGKQQAYWHRLRRIGSDKIFEDVTKLRSPSGKTSFCRGLWLVASAARRAGHECRWLDISPFDPKLPAEDCEWAEQLWLYAMTPTFHLCCEFAAQAKNVNPEITVFVGGPHTRYLYANCLHEHVALDFVEARPATPDSLAASIKEPSHMPGMARRDGEEVRVNPCEFPKYYSEFGDPLVLAQPLVNYYFNTSTSRGCCRTCAFCLEGLVPLCLRPVAEVKDELRLLDSHLGLDGAIHFFDTSLWATPKRCIELCEFISSEISIQHFSCDIEARRIRDDVLGSLARARMRMIAIGFESCRDDVLNFVGKNGSFADRLTIAEHVRRLMPNTAIKAYWLLGLPGSTEESLRDELSGIRTVLKQGTVDLVSVKLFVPYPGTPFFLHPAHYGLEVEYDFRRYDRFTVPPVCWPKAVGRELLADLLIECEKTVAECYAVRLGVTTQAMAAIKDEPGRYNGPLYVGDAIDTAGMIEAAPCI